MFVSGNLSFYGLSFSPASSLSTSFAPSPVSLSRSSSISPSATYIIYFEPSKNSPLSLFLNTQAKKVMKEIGADKSHYYFPHCSLTSFFKCNSNMIQNVVNTLMSIIQKNSDNLRCFYLYGRSCRDISCEDRPNYSEGEREEENEEGAMRKEVKNKKAVVNKNASFTKLFISRTNECESDTLNSSNNNHNSNAGKWVFLSNKEIEDAKNKVLFTKMMAANNCLICYEAIDNNAKNDFCDYNCNCYNKNNFSDFNYNDDNTNDSCMYNINHAVYSNINTNTIITPRSSITSFYSGNTDVQTADSDYETYANSDASCFSSLSSTPVPHAGICTTQTCNFSLSSPTSLPSPLSFVAQYKMNDNFFVNNEFVNLGEQKKKLIEKNVDCLNRNYYNEMQIYYDSKTKVVNKDASIEQNFIEEESKNNNNNAYELKRFDTDDNEENSLSKSENGNDNLINKIKGGVHTCECPPLHYPPSIASPLLYFPYSNHEIKLLNEDNDYLFVEDVCKKIRRICLEDTMFEKQDYLLKNVRNNLEFDMSNINDAMNINTNNGAAATHNEDLHTNYNISRNYSGSKKKDTKFVKLPSILPSTTSMSFEGENKEYNEQINDNSNKSIKSNSLCTPSLLSSLSLCLSLSTVTGGSFWRSSSYCNYLNGSREKMNLRLPYIPFGNNNSSNITDSIYNSNNNNILGRVYVHSELSCSSSPSPLNNEITKEQFSNNNNSSNANTATNKKNVPVEENNNNVLCTEDGYVIIPLQCSWITAIMNVLADELLQNFSFKIKTKSTPHITLAAERNKEAQSIISKFYEPLSDFIPQNEWDIVVYEQVKKSSDFETEGPHTFKEIKRIQKIAIS